MLITKFNKLIHNKIVWAVFAVLVSLSMVGLFTPTGDRSHNKESDSSAGTLFGKHVLREDLARERLFAQSFQPARNNSESEQVQLQEEAWHRLAIQQYAKLLGVSVATAELTDAIRRDPSFAVDGAFSRMRYQQLIQTQMRIPVSLFEDYLREELLLSKMRKLLVNSLWISPYELDLSVSRFTDLFTLQVLELSEADLVADAKATDDEIRAYYDRTPDTFRTPERRSVYYVEWPASNFVASVNVSEALIQDVYDRDLDKYSVTDTNTMTTSYIPLADVTNSIRAEIAHKEAIGIASESAMQFLDKLSMMDYGDDVSIQSVAAKLNVTVSTSEFFTVTESIPNLTVVTNFNQAAFKLTTVPDKSYSQTIIADDAVYVIAYYTNQPARTPAFDDVIEKVRQLADEDVRFTAFEGKLTSIQKSLKKAIAEKTPFAEAASALHLKVKAVGPFSVYDASPSEVPFFNDLAPVVLSLETGEFSDPVNTPEGALIAYVSERTAGDPEQAVALKPDITRMLQSSRLRLHFAAWSDYLLKEARGSQTASKTN